MTMPFLQGNTLPYVREEVNDDRDLVCLAAERGRRRRKGEYSKLSLTEKATIGKYACEHGVVSAVKKFKGQNVKESSVMDWRDAYLKELKAKLNEAKPGE